jgi:hypothetical protein
LPDDRKAPLVRAFDEVRFGRTRTLDLRTTLPTAVEAEARAEAWLRERQASVDGEVLIITGRGRGSEGGIAVVRPAIQRRLARLRRQGVISDVQEHSPGSFVVTLAPIRALLAAPRRQKDPARRPRRPEAPWAAGLRPATLKSLRDLAAHTLDALGAPPTDALIEDEMRHHYNRFAPAIGTGVDRDARLRVAIHTALDELSNE